VAATALVPPASAPPEPGATPRAAGPTTAASPTTTSATAHPSPATTRAAAQVSPAPANPAAWPSVGGCPDNSAVCLGECSEGNAASCFTYGSLNEKGLHGDPPDYVAALTYYKRACLGGNADGCAGKARLEATKPSNAAHDAKMLAWWQHKCEGPAVDGCSMVAMMYENGLNGAPKNLALAIQALQHGCDGGNSTDCSQLESLKRR
jgi:hypothetical protein